MVERLAPLFGSIDEDLERFFDAFLSDILCKPTWTQTSLHGNILDKLPWRHRAIGRVAKLGATANGGICFRDHAVSIPDRLELLFGQSLVGEHAGYTRAHRVATGASFADELA